MRRLGITDLDLLESLFEQLPGSPFFVKDRGLRYVAANTAMAKLCGVSCPRELYGRRVDEFFPADLAKRYEELDADVLSSGRAMTNMLESSMSSEGETAWLLYARVPVRAADGSTVGVTATSRRLKLGWVSEESYRRLSVVTERLRREFRKPLRLAMLAAEVGASASQLERDFRKLFSTTPQAFLQQIRMQEAMSLLQDQSASIAGIAHECGFADQSAFARRFKIIAGVTPSRYRRRFGRHGS